MFHTYSTGFINFDIVNFHMEVSFEDFKKMDIRVGQITKVEEPEGSKSMIKLTADFGDMRRTAMAGLKNYYKPDDLVGKKFVFVVNLERKKLMGVESECMILAADDGNGNVVLLHPVKDIEVGSKVH